MDPGLCHGMKANPTGHLCVKYECFLIGGCQEMDFTLIIRLDSFSKQILNILVYFVLY